MAWHAGDIRSSAIVTLMLDDIVTFRALKALSISYTRFYFHSFFPLISTEKFTRAVIEGKWMQVSLSGIVLLGVFEKDEMERNGC